MRWFVARGLGHARGYRACEGESEGAVLSKYSHAVATVPRRRACRPRSARRAGQLALAHVRHGQGLGLPRRPGRDRVHVPQGDRVVVELEHMGRPFDRLDTARSTSVFGRAHSNTASGRSARCAEPPTCTGHAMLHTLYQRNVDAKTQFFSSGWRST